MSTIEYSLFRAKFIKPAQPFLPNLLSSGDGNHEMTSVEYFLAALAERPTAERREGYTWHIGKIEFFTDYSGTFKVGRTAKGLIERFDPTAGDFLVEEQETSPYTQCVFDAILGIVGIARKSSLAPDVEGIAERLAHLLSKSSVIRENRVSVEIAPIPDPDDFLTTLSDAYQVSSFTATFRGPNPQDADEYFQQPLSRLLSLTNGKSGKAQIQGPDLNRGFLQSITRSTASAGNRASARVRKRRKEKTVTVRMGMTPIGVSYDRDGHEPQLALKDLSDRYHSVRQDENR